MLQLTSQEIESITAENDILIHIVGADYKDENIYRIDIIKGKTPTNLYNNDFENKVIGATDIMEWKYSQNDSWTSYKQQIPDLTGNKTVIIRVGATGVYLPSDELTYSFTENNQLDTQKYISIDNLAIFQVSSEEPGYSEGAQNAIDGNINTMWHSSWNGDDSERYITIKLNEPKYLSALQYVPRQIGNNGRIKDGKIFVSVDGKNWTEIVTITNWEDSPNPKMVVFNESVKSQYIKLVATENHGDGRDFITAAMINLFEDIIKEEDSETPLPDEEPKPEENPDEIPNPDEEPKPEETPDEIPTQDEEQTSNSNELDNTVTTETLPKTGLNTIILIIIFGVGILVVIFYIKMRTNLLKISKDR